jgi:predicted RNA-binding protein with PIN domain
MARQFLIIDGYNLMHAAGIARPTYGPGDLQRCRERLVRWLLEHLDESQRSDTQVVFDAAAAPSDSDLFQTVQGLHVVFAPAGTDADSEIERMLKKHSAPKQVIMVSSDHRLHKAAQRRKARPIDSEDFVAQMEEQPEPTSTHQSTNQSSSQPTTAEWEKIFGDIPEARELQQGQTGYPGEMPEIRDLDTT